MKKLLLSIVALVAAVTLWAVPAYRGWQTKTQPDGSTIEVRQMGDEFYHYWEASDGKQVEQNAEGKWESVGEAPSAEEVQALRAKAAQHRQRKVVGTEPNLAPRGVVILANFADSEMESSHTLSVFNELCNSENCTVNKYNGINYGSAAQYFADQSNNSYRPVFDVFGPVTLSHNTAYYGGNFEYTYEGKKYSEDSLATDAVIEACILANQQYSSLNFANYDSDNDGYVDFVYVIYAGKGEADPGSDKLPNTIWPHNYSIQEVIAGVGVYFNVFCHYKKADTKIDGKYLDNYACSSELAGSGSMSGIGTLCHEFGHVMGLPDFYDTNYGTNYENGVTPGDWNIMDGGSYNGGGHCPPNYDPWEKYFFGWVTPENLGSAGQNITLYPNGTSDYQSYQINSTNKLQASTTEGINYYIENRLKSGWDTYVPASGMLVWKVDFNASAWQANTPNNTAGSPRYTIVPADGKTKNYGASGDTYPTGSINTCTLISGHEITDIATSENDITFKYNGGVNGHNVVVNGTGCTIIPSATTVENGTALTATITPTDDTYDFSSLTVQLGSTTLTSGTHYTLSGDKKSLSINASSITGSDSNDLTITAVWTKNRYSYELVSENATVPDDGVVAKNAALNLTITPASGYTLANAACWEVEMGGNTLTYGSDFTYTAGTNTFSIASVTGDVVILVSGGIELTWMANNSPHATTVTVDGTIVLPASNPTPCDDKVFYGWCDNASYSSESTAPSLIEAGDAVASATTYYAVFATAEGGESTYQKVTAAPNDWSGNYLIVNEAAGVAFNGLSASGATDEVTINNGVIAYSDDLALNEVIIASMTNGYSVRMNSNATNNAGKYLSGTSGSNGMNFGDAAALNTLSYSSGNVTITSNTSVLRYNNAANSGDLFRYYKSSSYSTQQPIQLYRKTGGTSYSDFSTSCVPPTKYAITLNAGDHGALYSSPETEAAAGKTVTITIAPDAHYHLDAISANDGAVALSGTGLTRTFTMPETAVTVAATFAEDDQFTVRFFDNGTELSSESYYASETADVPSDPTPCDDDYTFVGWWTAELAADNTAAKSWVSDFTVSQAQDYYAIYSKTVTEEGNAYDVTFTAGTETSNTLSLSKDVVTFSVTQGDLSRNDNYRCYANYSMTVTATSAMTKIVMNCNATGTNKGGPGNFSASGYSSDGAVGTWEGEATSVTFSADKQVQINSMVVTIGSGSSSTTYYTSTISCGTTGVEETNINAKAVKILRNGQIFILREGRTYTLTGNLVK